MWPAWERAGANEGNEIAQLLIGPAVRAAVCAQRWAIRASGIVTRAPGIVITVR